MRGAARKGGPYRNRYEADKFVMKRAVIYPVTAINYAVYHSSRLHNAVFVPALEEFYPTNVWLSR